MSVRDESGVGPAEEQAGAEMSTGTLLAQMRGGGDEGEAEGAGAGPAPKARTARIQTFVTVLVLAGSVAALYAMRRQGMAAGVTFEETPVVEYTLDTVSSRPTAEQQRILADLERSTELAQVPAEKLPKNPFVLEGGTAGGEADLASDDARRLAEVERERKEREAELAAALAALELHGVMEGRVPLARINGATVRMGDTVSEMFTVVAIYGRSVDLEAEGQVYTLTVGEVAATKRGALRGPQGVE